MLILSILGSLTTTAIHTTGPEQFLRGVARSPIPDPEPLSLGVRYRTPRHCVSIKVKVDSSDSTVYQLNFKNKYRHYEYQFLRRKQLNIHIYNNQRHFRK